MGLTLRHLPTIVLAFCLLNLSTAHNASAQRGPLPRLTPVDLELAFVVDASGSIDEEEMTLQRQG